MCPRCKVTDGSLIHMLWRCPKLHRTIFQLINTIYDLFLSLDPRIGLPGILPPDLLEGPKAEAIIRTLYRTHKNCGHLLL